MAPEAVFLALPDSSGSDEVEQQLLAVVERMLPRLGFDTRAELQVLSPTKKLPGGVHSLNIWLQQVRVPAAAGPQPQPQPQQPRSQGRPPPAAPATDLPHCCVWGLQCRKPPARRCKASGTF